MISVQQVVSEPGLFHMRIMGAFIDRYGSDIFRTDQVRYEMDFYGHTCAIEFAKICAAYYEARKERPDLWPSSERHCKTAEVLIDGERIRVEYAHNGSGGHFASWTPGASFYDLSDVTQVKLTLLMSEWNR